MERLKSEMKIFERASSPVHFAFDLILITVERSRLKYNWNDIEMRLHKTSRLTRKFCGYWLYINLGLAIGTI